MIKDVSISASFLSDGTTTSQRMTDRNVVGASDNTCTAISFDLLSDPCRQSIFQYVLQTRTDSVSFTELATNVGPRPASSAETDAESQALELELRHVHLPMLDDAGLLEYEPSTDRIRLDQSAFTDCLEDVHSTVTALQNASLEQSPPR